jgi:hypothetical protein
MLTFKNPEVAIKLTKEEAIAYGIDSTQNNMGEIVTRGVWGVASSFKALCISAKFTKEGYTKCEEITLYGLRKLSQIKQSGYALEGRVSIRGKKYTAFTSSQLFEVEGKLIDVAIIHARIK